jgi:hypothetical protein
MKCDLKETRSWEVAVGNKWLKVVCNSGFSSLGNLEYKPIHIFGTVFLPLCLTIYSFLNSPEENK